MREALQAYVRRVSELAEPVPGNEPATRPSLVGPLFTILGDDLTGPRECVPEDRVDFGPNRSVKPANRKPILANSINEWTRQRTLTAVRDYPARSEPRAGGERAGGSRRASGSSSPTRLQVGRGRPSGPGTNWLRFRPRHGESGRLPGKVD